MKNLIFKIAILAGTVAAFASCSDTWLMYDTSQKDKLYFKYENYPSLDQYLSTDFSFALLDESVKEVKKTVTVTLLGMPADRDRTFEVRAIHDTTSNYTTGGVQRELIDAVENEDYTIDRLIVPAGSVEGQIEGGVVMSMGFALTEQYPLADCKPMVKFGTLGLPRANAIPEIEPIIVEKPGLTVAYGAIGIGEITSIPTAPAIADAYYRFDGKKRSTLPLADTPYSRKA